MQSFKIKNYEISPLDYETSEEEFSMLAEETVGEFYDPFADHTYSITRIGSFGEKEIVGGFSYTHTNIHQENHSLLSASPIMLKEPHRNKGIQEGVIDLLKEVGKRLGGTKDFSVHINCKRDTNGVKDFYAEALESAGFYDISHKYDKFEDGESTGHGFVCVDCGEPCSHRISQYVWASDESLLHDEFTSDEDRTADVLIEKMLITAGGYGVLSAVVADDGSKYHITYAYGEDSPYSDGSIFVSDTEELYDVVENMISGATISFILRTSDEGTTERLIGWIYANGNMTALTEAQLISAYSDVADEETFVSYSSAWTINIKEDR